MRESGQAGAHSRGPRGANKALSCCRSHAAFPFLGAGMWTMGTSLEQGESSLLWAEGEPESSRHNSEAVRPGQEGRASSQGTKVKGISDLHQSGWEEVPIILAFKVRARRQIQKEHTIRKNPQILFIFFSYLCLLKS